MACRGVHFAIAESEATRLLSADNDLGVLEIIQDEIEERWDEDWLYQTDKAWDAIHRCLTDGTPAGGAGAYPLSHAILGGRQLHEGDDYIVSLVTPEQAADVARALEGIDEAWLRDKYAAIDPEEYAFQKSEQDWAYTWENFTGLVQFFKKAGEAGRWVVFTVDQ